MPTTNLSLIPAFGFETSSYNSGKFINEKIFNNSGVRKKLRIDAEIKSKTVEIDDKIQKKTIEISGLKERLENAKEQIRLWGKDLRVLNYAKKNKLGFQDGEEKDIINANNSRNVWISRKIEIQKEGREAVTELKKLKFQKEEETSKVFSVIWKIQNVVKVLEYFPLIGSFFGVVRLVNTLVATKEQCPNKFAHITRAVLAILCVGALALPVDLFCSIHCKKSES